MSETTVGLGDAGNGSTTTTEKKTRGAVTTDPKLVACVKITNALDKLAASDREFVLRYIDEKYQAVRS